MFIIAQNVLVYTSSYSIIILSYSISDEDLKMQKLLTDKDLPNEDIRTAINNLAVKLPDMQIWYGQLTLNSLSFGPYYSDHIFFGYTRYVLFGLIPLPKLFNKKVAMIQLDQSKYGSKWPDAEKAVLDQIKGAILSLQNLLPILDGIKFWK